MSNDNPSKLLDLNMVIAEVEKLVRSVVGERASLKTQLDSGLGRIQAELGKIAWVIANLVMNAQDAITAGGELTITTANVELEQATAAEIHLSPGSYVRVGLTISRDEFSAHAQVREIIEQAHGAICLRRTPGGESTVTILLPRAPEVAPLPAPRSRTAGQNQAAQTILIVDDEAGQRDAIRMILEDEGYEVLEAVDGKEAEATLALYHVDLMITDIVMPEQDGLETIKSVRKKHPDLKIIAISTEPASHYLHAAKLLGAQSAMEKPLTREVLLAAVAHEIGNPPPD